MTQDDEKQIEDALHRWKWADDGKCPYSHQHGPWCDDAEIFLSQLRASQAREAAAMEVVERMRKELIRISHQGSAPCTDAHESQEERDACPIRALIRLQPTDPAIVAAVEAKKP